jgi:hypothetical protein
MLTCPMCKKTLPVDARSCPRCTADLTLLTDFLGNLRTNLSRADSLTREGRLGDAVWAYLEVLEVDPENPAAREQVGKVVTAVRQFDHASPSRRWADRLRRRARFRQWLETWNERRPLRIGIWILVALAALVGSFVLGYFFGRSV